MYQSKSPHSKLALHHIPHAELTPEGQLEPQSVQNSAPQCVFEVPHTMRKEGTRIMQQPPKCGGAGKKMARGSPPPWVWFNFCNSSKDCRTFKDIQGIIADNIDNKLVKNRDHFHAKRRLLFTSATVVT